MDRRDEPKADGWKSLYGNEPLKNNGEAQSAVNGQKPRQAEEDKLALRRDAAGPQRQQPHMKQEQAQQHQAQQRQRRQHAQPQPVPPRSRRQAQPNAEASAPPAYARRRKPLVLLWSFLIAVGLVLAATGSAAYYVWSGLQPTRASDTPVRVTIERGMKAQKVAELLEEKGLIRDAQLFSSWLKLKNEGSRFQAGIYELTPGMSRDEIVEKLNKGDIVAEATMRFTIPEGWTIEQIAERISQNGMITKQQFLEAAANRANWTGSAWTSLIPPDDNLLHPLEGYLFPDTYEMKTESSAVDIINRMLSELDRKLGQLPEDWQATMHDRELTLHELLTIASLIEREVVVDEERALVAGVIENRLRENMPLQIDATIQYLLDKPRELLLEDLKVESPYNTYLNPGLPPGPIASPSLKSIEAALYPEETEYFYYVTKKDGSNTHLFAKTLREHQRNIEQSNRNAQQ